MRHRRLSELLVVVCFTFMLQSCATYGDFAMTMRDGLLAGKPAQSLTIIEQEDPSQTEVIASLDKGMLRRMTGDYSGSNKIFEVAKQEIEKLYGVSITENFYSMTINETFRGYEGDRYEQLLLHAYMAMNYIQLGEFDGARVEMLQAKVKMMEWGDEPEEDAFIRYLSGIIYESLGEFDDALISYRQAYIAYKENDGKQYPLPSYELKSDLLRLLAWQGLWDEYKSYKKEFGMATYKPVKQSAGFGELVIMLNNGLAPVRSETAIQIFSSDVQQNLRVAFPVYRTPAQTLYTAQVVVGDQKYALEAIENIDALARHSLEQDMPGIMARATARAVVKYNTQSNAQDQGSLAGLLMTVTNMVTERADTRSWTTLPQEIQLKRVVLPVGKHQVRIQMLNAAGQVVDVLDEEVTIRSRQASFMIKHWNTPVPKAVTVSTDSKSASAGKTDMGQSELNQASANQPITTEAKQ